MVEWPASASLEPEMLWREAKFFLHCWRASGGKSPKCLRLKWLVRRTQWSHGKISLRTMGLGQEVVGSLGPHFFKLPMRNVSLTGIGWPLNILYRDHSIRQGLCSCTVVVHPWWDFDYSLVGHMLAIAPCSAATSVFQFLGHHGHHGHYGHHGYHGHLGHHGHHGHLGYRGHHGHHGHLGHHGHHGHHMDTQGTVDTYATMATLGIYMH